MSGKIRLDQLLVKKELSDSLEQAQRLILAGKIKLDGHPATKPGFQYAEDVQIELEEPPPYVSRGGEKLAKAFEVFPFTVTDCICIDIGASTGGFTDCLLQHGATKVYAIDVGRGQLHQKMLDHTRVDSREKVNARYLTQSDFSPPPSRAVVDVSFISLSRILPALSDILETECELVTLIKPQFEARREQIEKGGVVRDTDVHDEVQERIKEFGTKNCGFQWVEAVPSPLKGPAGNVEFLAYWKRS